MPVYWFTVVMPLSAILGLIWAVSWERFRSELEQFHPGEWIKAGKPQFSSFARGDRLVPYILRGEYREAHDARLIRLGDRARWAAFLMLCLLAGAAVMTVALR